MRLLDKFERRPLRSTIPMLGNLRVEHIFEVGNGVQTAQQMDKIRNAMLKHKKAEFFVILIKQ